MHVYMYLLPVQMGGQVTSIRCHDHGGVGGDSMVQSEVLERLPVRQCHYLRQGVIADSQLDVLYVLPVYPLQGYVYWVLISGWPSNSKNA